MKTADLTGRVLDHWVAQALGYFDDDSHAAQHHYLINDMTLFTYAPTRAEFKPSTEGRFGQPIIERERISSMWAPLQGHWCSVVPGGAPGRRVMVMGPTALIAAMRAFVASTYGDQVPDDVEANLRVIARFGEMQDAPPLQTALLQIEMDSPQRNPEGFP